jgi:hypothetical protein
VPEENGIAERCNRTLLEKVRSILTEANIGNEWWSFAVLTACFQFNRTPNASIENYSPFELRYGLRENYFRLKPFGCKILISQPKEKRKKLDLTSHKGILLGYIEKSTEYVALDFVLNEIVKAPSTSRFKENEFPGIPEETLRIILLREDLRRDKKILDEYEGEVLESFITSKSNIPHDLIEVIESPDREKWENAVKIEMEKMKSYGVIEEVPMPDAHVNIISTRLVFSKKTSNNKDQFEYKAKLVARGFEDREFIEDVFAPTPHLETLRFLFSYFAMNKKHGVSIQGFDVKAAFLNAKLEREVFVYPPNGMQISKDKCWKLKKAIYGLNDAPKLWSETFRETISRIGLKKLSSDQCLYLNSETKCFLFYHVDDCLVCGLKEI